MFKKETIEIYLLSFNINENYIYVAEQSYRKYKFYRIKWILNER